MPLPFPTEGDGSKIAFGMCISDCSGTGSNANGAQTLSIMRQLQAAHPDMGGMMFWDTRADSGGSWSKPTFKYVCVLCVRRHVCFERVKNVLELCLVAVCVGRAALCGGVVLACVSVCVCVCVWWVWWEW